MTQRSRRRVGVNLTWLRPGIVGGSEDSTVAALVAIAAPTVDAGIDLVLFGRDDLWSAHPSLNELECVTVAGAASGRVRRVFAENTALARTSRRHGIDLMHHAGGVVPPLDREPCTLTIHDLQPLDLPEHFSATKRTYLRAMLGRSARTARRVAVPSEFVQGRVIDRLGIDGDRVQVVPWSVATPEAPDHTAARAVAVRYGVGERFVLCPAITYPHKNHATLLDAFAQVARDDDDLELVLTGGVGPSEGAVAERIGRADLAGRVRRLGRIPRADLDRLYEVATMMAFPSTYEGFGLPPLEAMVRGCPVIVSRSGSLPEVISDEMMSVEALDIAGWAAAMQAVSSNPELRRTLVAAGAEAASRFSAGRTAAALLDMWTRALDETP